MRGAMSFRIDDKGEWRYVTGIFTDRKFNEGRFMPMGWSKDLDSAIEFAKLHKHVLCELRVIKDYRDKD